MLKNYRQLPSWIATSWIGNAGTDATHILTHKEGSKFLLVSMVYTQIFQCCEGYKILLFTMLMLVLGLTCIQ